MHPLTVLTRCEILGSTSPKFRSKPKPKPKPRIVIPFGTPEVKDEEAEEEKEQLLVLFRADNPDHKTTKDGVSKIVKEGWQVWVWEPWMSVGVGIGVGYNELEGVFERAGIASGSSGVHEVGREIVFCTRYAVQPNKQSD